jgi:hypothetical protein
MNGLFWEEQERYNGIHDTNMWRKIMWRDLDRSSSGYYDSEILIIIPFFQ